MYHLTTIPRRRLIHLHLSGMLSLDQLAALSQARDAAARTLAQAGGGFAMLVEVSGSDFQTQAVMQAIELRIRTAPLKADRIAIVPSGAASRMQARRLAKMRGDVRLFDDAAAAGAWLDEAPRQAAHRAAPAARPGWSTAAPLNLLATG